MRRVLCLLIIVLLAAASASAQDFAQHYISSCSNDTAVHCTTISPRMMGEMLRAGCSAQDSEMKEIISHLKSCRIVEVSDKAKRHYKKAEQQLRLNKQRFDIASESDKVGRSTLVGIRRKGTDIVELVAICFFVKENKFMVIDLTGDDLSEVQLLLSRMVSRKS